MNVRQRFVLLLNCCVVLLLSGCTPSLNPIYTEQDLVFDPALLGFYPDPNYKENFVAVERFSDPRYYGIIQHEGRAQYRMVGKLIKVGDQRFMDITPEEPLQVDVTGAIGATDFCAH